MNFKDLKNKIKEEQKQLAQEIRELKSKRKSVPYGYVNGLDYKREDYRHTHIMYCNFFNQTPYDMIERDCYESPNSYILDKLRESWEAELDEDVRDCA